jgi:tetratricopeptide (TPR) repeat protein
VLGWQGWMGWRWGSDRLAKLFNDRGVTQQLSDRLYLAQVNFERAIALKPNYPEAHYHLGRNYELLGDIKQARKAYENAQRGKIPEAYNNLARLDILEGRSDRAIPRLQEGLTLTQDETIRYALLKNLGWASLSQKQYPAASSYLEQAIALEPDRASAYCLLAQVEESRSRETAALDRWQLCRKLASRTHLDEKGWLQTAEERLLSGQRRKAIK